MHANLPVSPAREKPVDGPLPACRENAYSARAMMHRFLPTAVLVFLLTGAAAAPAAETIRGAQPAEEFDPLPLIGMEPSAALAAFGPPREIFALRGTSEAEDDVVFFYDPCIYLFWFQNRVWQVRVDRRFDRRVLGLAIGMSMPEVEAACPGDLRASGGSLFFDVPDCPCPVRVRLLFDADGLADIYVYRSDY
jgi:hypothetical protein